jgi:DNA invertase Pin-like site-specific DNA recombinase
VRVAGYVRVSTREQGDSGLGLEAQRAKIAEEVQRRGWRLERLAEEVSSGASMEKRGELRALLEDLDAGRYDVLMVSRLDRLSRSLGDFAVTVDRARRHRWRLVMLDPALDMTDPWGEAVAGMAAVFAQLERSLISQRTTAALVIARARGTFRPGEHLRYTDAATVARLERWARQGVTQRDAAARLNAEGVPGPGGGQWHARTIGRILARARATPAAA